jgi:hypothetical protein
LLLAFVSVVQYIGFRFSAALYLFFTMTFLSGKRSFQVRILFRSAVLAVALASIFYIIFKVFARIPLPDGRLFGG